LEQQQYNNFINQRARGISNTRDRTRSSNRHHHSRPLMSHSVGDGADGGGSSNGGTMGDAVDGDATADEMNSISIENDNDNNEDDDCVLCMEGFEHHP
jgi:hypothetical protein